MEQKQEVQDIPILLGYRKWTATFAPLIVAALALVFNNPAQQEAWGQVVTGVVDLVAIGLTAWATTSYHKANVASKQIEAEKTVSNGKAEAEKMEQPDGSGEAQPQPAAATAPTWDVLAFDKLVKEKAPLTYGVLNPSTEFYQALNEGQVTQADYIEHVEAFWDFALMKADARFNDIWGYGFAEAIEKVREPGCPKAPSTCGSFSNLKHKALALGEQFYIAYLDYDRTRQKLLDVRALMGYAARGFDWKGRLATSHQNLYFVGEMAAALLAYCQ